MQPLASAPPRLSAGRRRPRGWLALVCPLAALLPAQAQGHAAAPHANMAARPATSAHSTAPNIERAQPLADAATPMAAQAVVSATVTAATTDPPTPIATATASPTAATSPLSSTTVLVAPTPTARLVASRSTSGVDNAAYVADLTIPDGTIVAPGQGFTKTWLIRNAGTTTWDSRYHWHFEAGAPLGPVRSIASPSVPPGGTAEFTVRMTAPTSERQYLGIWQMTTPNGDVFGQQATVVVRVQKGVTPTPTSAPTPTIAPTATGTPVAAPPTATPVPTPRPPDVAWFGPPRSRDFFAEGYTSLGYQEYLSLLNPRPRTARAQLTIVRADGATRSVAVTLGPLARRTLDLDVLAPRASTALRVDADGPLVAERALYPGGGSGSIVAGAPLPARRWYAPEGYVGRGFDDGLRIFNPGAVPAALRITAYASNGAQRVSLLGVQAGQRINVPMSLLARHGATALAVDASAPVVVESIINAAGTSGPTAAMALTGLSRQWYFPDGGTSGGDKEFLSLFNPNGGTASVRVETVTSSGYMTAATVSVRSHARATVALHDLVRRAGLAVALSSRLPIVAQEVRYTRSGAVSLSDGAAASERSWALADGYAGTNFQEALQIFNPGESAATATIRLIGRNGVAYTGRLRTPGHRRYVLVVNGRLPNGPVAALVNANRPIVVGRTVMFNGDKGLSSTAGVVLPNR